MLTRFFTSAGVLCVAAIVHVAHAEPPPGTYDRLRVEAEDAVTFQVTSVKEAAGEKAKEVTVEAKVLGVERSKAGLKKGDAVTITYSVPTILRPGPTPVPVLDRDGVYPAFLNKRGKTFAPAAAGSSFRMTPEPPESDREAYRLGRAVVTVEQFLKANPADAAKLKGGVVGVGQGVDVERWVRARLADEVRVIQAWIRDTRPEPEKAKELNAKIELIQKAIVEIDAPR